jgi:hypothetical protein
LKFDVIFEILEQFVMEMSDNEAVKLLQKERRKLFNQIFESDRYLA